MPTTTPKRIRLTPHDPFDLIRLLARSQSDPRKAMAELVQNSLDAGAKHIEVTWYTQAGRRAIRIWDDGEGIFPELEREDALVRIARTVGHSHKCDLSPSERREQMVLGKYGIGLIGFWSVGETMDIRSRVNAGSTWILRLQENRPDAQVQPARAKRLDEAPTFTEITVRPVHEAAVNKIRPARLQAYLANELRGQLLERDATVVLLDRVARGRARKRFEVKPQPFLGQPLEAYRELEVPGFESARIELYVVQPEEERHGRVALSCGGTVVMDDVTFIDGDDVPRTPWDSGRLEGVIDFPDLYVAPGTRRGFVHDEPVHAFLSVLPGLERALSEQLRREDTRREEARHESLAKDIRRAFRSVANRLPEYELFEVSAPGSAPGSSRAPGSAPGVDPARGPGADDDPVGGEGLRRFGSVRSEPIEVLGPEPAEDLAPAREPDALFPPGPLDRVRLRPPNLRVATGGRRRIRAEMLDADGRPAAGAVDLEWRLDGAGSLDSDGPAAIYTAPDESATSIRITAIARQGSVEIEAVARVTVTDPPPGHGRVEGIPEPSPIHVPAEPWRSRVRHGVWEYNSGHRDYVTAAATETGRLRYLIQLFAKEVVARNFGGPGDGQILERMVEILTCIDSGRHRT